MSSLRRIPKRGSPLSACGGEGGHHLPGAGSFCGAVSAGELAGDHRRTQLPFRQVVGGFDRIVPQEGEEVILLLEQPLPHEFLVGLSPGLSPQAVRPFFKAEAGSAADLRVNPVLGGFEGHGRLEHHPHFSKVSSPVVGVGLDGF